ncbi:beta-ketoacyl synthase N-terminal-like domain-containing protein [Mesorhizobium sp. B2-3-4]|uniref:beta-ketoacyl synthase N-terminal-like domain-containing protein n=1 Tax=Mesorhizobium sp. B2-3-4 TaxID=2589959 RepID=UPI00112E1C2E|nr:beta-ketoacyl synthase N-terminal-like domain-containing protein [Mesorhizobium sp. B2-3-4]TPM36088.1 KR domain-containing protein [Mesorhizobium sp. B2-3-4]
MNSQTDISATASNRPADPLQDIRSLAAAILETDPDSLDPDEVLGYLGFDSASLKLLASRLSGHFSTQVDTILLFTYPTLRSLSEHLAEQGQRQPAGAGEAQAGLGQQDDDPNRDIAIVGIGCRLPGAASKEEFWDNQAARRNCIGEVPRQRWDWRALSGDPLRESGRTDVKWAGFIKGEDQFSPEFFGISVYEAEQMDPQQRLFLKAAWEAIWDAGHDPKQLADGAVGVFAGVQFQDYQKLLDLKGVLSAQACTGNAHAMLANRVSFLLDVHGPSEAIDTACSSSLVAIHNAVRAIRNGECDLAIAGGVNLLLAPDLFVMGRQLGVLSPTGQCRTFDAGADGYARGEGVAALLLKPLEKAVADRDHIYGVIKGTAVNHGGKAASLTAPNSRAQADLVMRAFRDARLTPNDVSYVEMHGTGTELGDPIEVEGVKAAFHKLRAENGLPASPCALGSVKTNIGHLEPAAGVAGVTNVVMAMANRTLPGLSNFRHLNPHIRLEDGFSVQSETTPWQAATPDLPLGAVVNSFGFGGANACVVLREHRRPRRQPTAGGKLFVPVTASNAALMKVHAAALARAIGALEQREDDGLLADIAFTLQGRKESRAMRAIVRASSISDLLEGLTAIADGHALPKTVATSGSKQSAPADWPDHVTRWLDTGATDWPDIVHAGRRPLPISPWPDRSCWFEPRAGSAVVAGDAAADPARMIYFEPCWQSADVSVGRPLDGRCIWVIGRNEAQIEAFETGLRDAVTPKTTLVTSLVGAMSAPEPSLDVWNLAGDEPDIVIILPPEPALGPRMLAQEETGILFGLAKALMEQSFGREVDLFYVAGQDFGLSPVTDALPAFAKSAFLENERLKMHTLYFSDPAEQDWRRLLAAEVIAAAPRTPLTIRFAPTRAVRGLREAGMAAGSSATGTWFRPDGVYLIAGGAGELGFRLLDTLIGEVDATFILCGRSPGEGAVAQRIDALRARANRPGSVHYVSCDIAEIGQTRGMIEGVLATHGRLNGIVNMVTAHNDAYLYRKDWEDFTAVSASKVQGTVNLDLATAKLDLDFFVAFSSLAALGLAGGSDYAYGCAFQNAFAGWRNRAVAAGRRSGASHAISWSRWKWDKYVTESFDDWFASLGYAFLDIAAGLDAWRTVLGRGSGEIFALQGWREPILQHLDLDAGLLRSSQVGSLAEGASAPAPIPVDIAAPIEIPSARQSVSQAPARQSPQAEARTGNSPRGDMEGALSAIVSELLKLDELDPHSPFPSIGLDSVMAIRLIVLVEQRLARRLSPKDLLQYPSVAQLAGHMRAQDAPALPADLAAGDDLDAVATYLASSLKKMLRADEILPDAKFGNLGVDSIMAVKLASEFDRRFEIGISPRWFIDFPSIERMAREIESRRSARH